VDLDPQEFLIARVDEILVGSAATSPNKEGGYFYGLAVRREWQNRGIGSALMMRRLDDLEKSGRSYAVALVMFWNSSFFRHFGFTPVPRISLPLSSKVHPELLDAKFKRSSTMVRRFESR
jgi:N-acetylglutamate synthase-like GNAT family acetyltransferase